MALVLAIETSCDETAVALLREGDLLASEIASQAQQHAQFGGVVPEVASRNHVVHAPKLVELAIANAGIELRDVDAFAATSGPGLASSLMIGASLAKGFAIGFGKPYLAINHLEGHLLSPFFGCGRIEPNVSLIVSGGHTLLVHVRDVGDYEIVGRTLDDAAGEAFDKVAKMLGLGYPGGPEIERCARGGDPARFDLPRSMLGSGDLNFSFSGLKTAVRYLLEKLPSRDERVVSDVCAAVQSAIVEVLVVKTIEAAGDLGLTSVTISGGVSCNGELRRQMRSACHAAGFALQTAEPRLCTDNAAMIAFAASLRFARGFASDVTEEIDPNLALAG